jgi:hypothetical protein
MVVIKMIPSIAVFQIVTVFADALAADTTLNDYCQAQFGKDVTIYIGYNGQSLPGKTNCPYVVLNPDQKVEGADETVYQYTLTVDWAIANETQTTGGKIVKLNGVEQCDRLGQLILACLNQISGDHPIASVVYRIAATKAEATALCPQNVGQMRLTINIARPIGMAISYP